MNYFEHDLGLADGHRLGASIWVRDKAYTPRKQWLVEPLGRQVYEQDRNAHLYLRWIDDQFQCGNPACESRDVVCIWYHYDGIAMGVDNTYGEFYCEKCAKYTFVEYCRDSS